MTAVTREETINDLKRKLYTLTGDYNRLELEYQRRTSRQEGEILGLYDRLQEAHQESAKVWNLVPAWVQRQEIKKATSWECVAMPDGRVQLVAECDFRGALSCVTWTLFSCDSAADRRREIRTSIAGIERAILEDQFKLHKIRENDVHRNRRADL